MVKKSAKSNYSNDDESSSPFRKGRLRDVVKPKRPRYTRSVSKSDREVADELTVDLVQVFADVGIVISGGAIRTIAKGLLALGWIRQRKIIDNDKK